MERRSIAELMLLFSANPILRRLGPRARLKLAREMRPADLAPDKLDLSDAAAPTEVQKELEQDQLLMLFDQSALLATWRLAVPGAAEQSAQRRAFFIGNMLVGFRGLGDPPAYERLHVNVLERATGYWIPGELFRACADARTLAMARLMMALSFSPSLRQLSLTQRYLLAEHMRPRKLKLGQELYSRESPPEAMMVLSRSAAVEVVVDSTGDAMSDVIRRHDGPIHIPRQFGDVVGAGALVGKTSATATVTAAGQAFVLPPRNIKRLRLSADGHDIINLLERTSLAHRRVSVFVAALRTHPVFDNVSDSKLGVAGLSGQAAIWRVLAPPPPPFGVAGGIAVVLRGRMLGYRKRESGPSMLGHYSDLHAWLPAGSAFGVPDAGPTCDHANLLEPVEPSWIVFLTKETIKDVMDFPGELAAMVPQLLRSGPYTAQGPAWDGLEASDLDIQPLWKPTDDSPDAVGAEAVLVSPVNAPWPDAEAVLHQQRAMMLSLREQFQERSLLVRILADPGAASEVRASDAWDELIVPGVGAPDEDAEHRAAALYEAVRAAWSGRRERRYSYVFFTVESCEGYAGEALTALRRLVALKVHRVQYLSVDPLNPYPETVPGVVPCQYVARLPLPGEQRGEGYVRFPAGAARVRMNLFAESPEAALAFDREGIDRWARTLSKRAVGLALGGGGSWGMAHIALLRSLTAHGVPIDVLTGTSGGTLVGNYYAARGVEGVDTLVERRFKAQIYGVAAMATMEALVQFVRDDLGDVRLEDLSLAWYPVATDLLTGSLFPIRYGSLSLAERRSGGLSPIYSGTPDHGATLVDGGFSRNVPSGLLHLEGARLLIASNIIAPSLGGRPTPPRVPGRLGYVLSDMRLLRRLVWGWEGAMTLFNYAGSANPEAHQVNFTSNASGVIPLDFLSSGDMIRDFRSAPPYWQNIAAVLERWHAIRMPRVDVDGVGEGARAQGVTITADLEELTG